MKTLVTKLRAGWKEFGAFVHELHTFHGQLIQDIAVASGEKRESARKRLAYFYLMLSGFLVELAAIVGIGIGLFVNLTASYALPADFFASLLPSFEVLAIGTLVRIIGLVIHTLGFEGMRRHRVA